jgi:hydrophobe/amphiphile efflux-3 (HAE3) family protein
VGTLVDPASDSFEATEAANEVFGDDAVLVLVQGPLENTLLTPDLGRLRDLEGCLAGNAPAEDTTLPPVCREFADTRPAKVVYGPATFINQAALELNEGLQTRLDANDAQADALARSARRSAAAAGASPAEQRRAAGTARDAAQAELEQQLISQALRYGITTPPAINNPRFVEQLVFTPPVADRIPKARFAGFFPGPDAALIQVRLRPDLSESERERVIELIRTATASERFQPQRGGELVVTGVPVVVEGLAAAVERSLVLLLLAAVAVMAATLALVFRSRLRLLPLALALAAAGLSFGAISLAGGTLTMASIAALPVLIGLAVDYAIQFQSRFDEAGRDGDPPGAVAAPRAAAAGGPTIFAAGLATAAGFLVLLMSPVPMVRGFAVLLVLGVVFALGCALTAGFAALAKLSGPGGGPPALARARGTLASAGGALASRARRRLPTRRPSAGRGRLGRAAARVSGLPAAALRTSLERPRRVLAIGLALAVVGWALDTQTEVVSDVRELVPQELPALQDLSALQEATAVSGQIDVTIRGESLTSPEVVAWIADLRSEVLAAHGYDAEAGESCGPGPDAPELCPALALPDLPGVGTARTEEEVNAALDAIPPYFQQAVVSPDREVANLAFGIRLMPLDRQQEVIEDIRSRLDPPPGVTADLTGIPVLAAEGNAALGSPVARFGQLLAGMAVVFCVLLAIYRRPRTAAIPLIPIVLATGWAALILFLLRVPLNPMSAGLGALVIAISTEFSVLLAARYREERAAGADPRRAVELAYGSTGAAVLASGITAIAGFAVLAVPLWSEIQMLRDFGLVTVVGLGVSLLGVMVALPAALVWAEEHGRFGARDLDPRRAWAALRARRRTRGRAARGAPAADGAGSDGASGGQDSEADGRPAAEPAARA